MKDLSTSKTILVPHDFTKVASTALEHANHIAKLLDKSITLLHVIEKETERKAAEEKLMQISKDNIANNHLPTESVIVTGSIFNEIGRVADTVKAALVVMGTHGIKGIQKLVGSWALKVITNSNVPYIVVQEKPFNEHGYKNIVLPIDFTKEVKQKLAWAVYIGNLFKSKCHLIADYRSDEFMANKIKNNVEYSKAVLKDNGIEDVEVYELDKKSAGLDKETMKYAQKIDADLIVVMTTLDKGISEYILGASEQYIIANEAQIPVMTIKPFDITKMVEGFSIMYFGS